MKPIEKDELFEHVSGFLKNRGVEMKEGSYTKGIQTGCGLLSDAINLSQSGFERARVEIEKKLDQMRQVIHESTAPAKSAKPKTSKSKVPRAKSPSERSGAKGRKQKR
jgi:hypothetical protein